MQILPVAVMFRYRTFQKSFIPLASRPLLLFLVQECQIQGHHHAEPEALKRTTHLYPG
ncbi:hypothetical protein GW080_08315 [Escherichia coli]|nr:hypothetical protein [Escherichia coli]ENB20085.1 hypothetical protein ECBCE011MS01_3259 [Escherichia coli BCE011_MS-01]